MTLIKEHALVDFYDELERIKISNQLFLTPLERFDWFFVRIFPSIYIREAVIFGLILSLKEKKRKLKVLILVIFKYLCK